MIPEGKRTLTPGARQVLEVLVLVAVIAIGAVEGYRALAQPAEAMPTKADIKSLNDHIDHLSDRLDRFNTRLSWLEGATSGSSRP